MEPAKAQLPQVCQISRLPAALLARILQSLPQRERLASCATVCTSWAAAAAAATVEVDLPCARSKDVSALQPWLERHARHLVSLRVELDCCAGKKAPQLHLPCADLLSLSRLKLEGQMLLLNGSASSSTAAAAGSIRLRSGTRLRSGPQLRPGPQPQLLPKLRQLELASGFFSADDLLQLSVLTGLTSLHLSNMYVGSCCQQQEQLDIQHSNVLSSALCTLLAQLPQLEHVELSLKQLAGSGLSSVVQQLSSLRQLRSVGIDVPEKAAWTGDLLSTLPPGLTALSVLDWQRGKDWEDKQHPAVFPQQMPQLSDLQELQLQRVAFHPGVPSELQRLQRLELHACTLLPRVAAAAAGWGDDALVAANPAAVSALLAAVGGMTVLVSLVFRTEWPGGIEQRWGWEAAPAEAFRGLTASSKLQELCLECTDELPLPWGAVQHAFPAGRVLPHLQTLALVSSAHYVQVPESREGRPGCMSAQDLRAVVRACPALSDLRLHYACASDDLTPLLQLPSTLTGLQLAGSALGDGTAAAVAQLTQLKSLEWNYSPDLTDAGLEHLTALTGLTHLEMFMNEGLSAQLMDDGVALEEGGCGTITLPVACVYVDPTGRGTPGFKDEAPVWQLLFDRLEKSPQLWDDRLLKLKARWQQQVTELQRQLSQTRALRHSSG